MPSRYLSVDVGTSTFLSGSEFVDALDALGTADAVQWSTEEATSSPHIGVNLHVGDNWVIGTKYQSKRRSVLEIRRELPPFIDRVTSSTTWFSIVAERTIVSNERHSLFAAAGASRAISKGSAQINGAASSIRITEVDPLIRTGYSYKWKRWETQLTVTKRFADDDSDEIVGLSLRHRFTN